jgi:hypothetical protein
MKRIVLLMTLLVGLLLGNFYAYGQESSNANRPVPPPIEYVTGYYKGEEIEFKDGEILVKFKNETEPYRKIKVSNSKVIQSVEDYHQKRNDVEWAEPNMVGHAN